MALNIRCTFLALIPCVLFAGCGLNSAVLQKGGNECRGVLLNYSSGAGPFDPIDPAKPTIVITHGWNPLPRHIRTTFGSSGAHVLRCRCGDSYNLLSWDWNAVRISPFQQEPIRVAKNQGQMLACALRARGVEPHQTHMIGHSLGALVVAQAAHCLCDMGPTAQVTLLDPPNMLHDEVFCNLAVTRHALIVENYWSPGISGFGSEVNCPGVRNYVVRGQTPVRGIIDLSMSNHVDVMRWYYETMRCPNIRSGFQQSTFVDFCNEPGRSVDGETGNSPLRVSDSVQPDNQARQPKGIPQTATTSVGSRMR